MKKKATGAAAERQPYLETDLAGALSKMQPLRLELEFPSPTQSISIRLPRKVLDQIRILADERDVPYQTLIKMWLVDRLKKVA